MIKQEQIKKIKELAEEFFNMTTIPVSSIGVSLSVASQEPQDDSEETWSKDIVDLTVSMEEPQILIGQQGQTLFEIQRLLRMILNKKLQANFYLNLDINDYKKKKVEYLKDLAKSLADQVALDKEEKELSPMSAYERRVIHSELSKRTDVATESRGQGPNRFVVIKPK
jgi:spoIIIJ-associated protein